MELQSSTSTGLANDAASFDALRAKAERDPNAVVREAAKQFESIFMRQMMKTMREANAASGMLDNAGTQMGTEMLESQFATQLTGLPGGLADVIARQLQRQIAAVTPAGAAAAAPTVAAPVLAAPTSAAAPAPTTEADASVPAAGDTRPVTRQSSFLLGHHRAARSAEAETGIPAAFMVAQAAHESGWGRREIRMADGSPSHNLFGIKAGPGWKGRVAEAVTTEYVDGEARRVTAKFRAYESYDESFRDYARLIKESPRYSRVVASAGSAEGFAKGLQRAGYATDPAYADKLTRTINTTLRLQRVVV